MATFKEAFAKARKELGAGKTFTWNGKSYTTDYAEEAGKKAAPKPKARPEGLKAKTDGGARPTVGGAGSMPAATAKGGLRDKDSVRVTATATPSAGAGASASARVPMDSTAKAKMEAEDRRKKSQEANKPKSEKKKVVGVPSKRKSPFEVLGDIVRGGGLSMRDKRRREAEKEKDKKR